MSNLGPFGGNKNPPWGRNSVGGSQSAMVGQANSLQQQMLNQGSLGNMNVNPTGMVQFQQSQVFQSPISMQQQNLSLGLQQMNQSVMNAGIGGQLTNQMYPQVGTVTYPNPRALNPSAFQTQAVSAVPPVQNASQNASTKQRVFTGTVTKVHDNFGFVDEDVFFQTNACVKGSNPIVGDRVLVEASFNPTMPFKWNATRIQVLPMSSSLPSRNSNSGNQKMYNSGPGVYNAVPPPNESSNNGGYLSSNRNSQRSKGSLGGRGRDRSRSRDREEEEAERKRRREERIREREEKEKKSPSRRRSRSPKSRRRTRVVPRYMVQIPKIALNIPEADVLEIRRRYNNLYVPSDFFCSQFRWIEAFPPNSPFSLNKPCSFHIMHKDVDPVAENPAVLEPADADYLFSAKVMLMSVPSMEEIYQKCCCIAEDKEKKDSRDSEEKDFVHPARLINFLVGLRGKNETMAIGGPWSPSLDGENPDKDPSVLIKTAIRTCRALTGIDLSHCTEWYRFVELYYRRGESTHKGRVVPARVETTTIYIPNVFNCLPTGLEWDSLHRSYSKQLERKLRLDGGQDCEEATTADEKEEEPQGLDGGKLEPTHYSQLDAKTMIVSALRSELKARNINCKGLKSQLVARLSKALKNEAEKTEEPSGQDGATDGLADVDSLDDKKRDKESEEKKLDEKEKAQLEKRYTLSEEPQILVHPSRVAKSGKFDCTSMSLSLLLDYRPEDTKEHSFEVSLFAELFNEMLMRDFGFNIYKALHELPDKPKEKDEKKKKDDDSGSNKKSSEDDKNKKEDGKKSSSRDDKESSSNNKKDERKKKDEDDDDFDDEDQEDDEEEKKEEDKGKDKARKSSDRSDKKKKERPKLITKDKSLLLSFVYFDQSHCGYVFEKDIEELLYTLGLSLSRAQVRKLIAKVVTRDSLHYRKLTDKPKEDDILDDVIVIDDSEKVSNLDELASGNKRLLPVFENDLPNSKRMKGDDDTQREQSKISDGFVMYKGALVDIEKLMAQLQRSEKARVDTEAAFFEIKNTNAKLTERNTKCNATIKSLSSDVKDLKEKLHTTDETLTRMTACSKLFHTTLSDVKEKIELVVNSKLYTNDKPSINNSENKKDSDVKVEPMDKDKKNEDGVKSRWESIDSKAPLKPEIQEEIDNSPTKDL